MCANLHTSPINIRTLGVTQALIGLLIWAHSPDEQAATIHRRLRLSPLSGTLALISGPPGTPLGPSKTRDGRDSGPAARAKPLEPKLSI